MHYIPSKIGRGIVVGNHALSVCDVGNIVNEDQYSYYEKKLFLYHEVINTPTYPCHIYHKYLLIVAL